MSDIWCTAKPFLLPFPLSVFGWQRSRGEEALALTWRDGHMRRRSPIFHLVVPGCQREGVSGGVPGKQNKRSSNAVDAATVPLVPPPAARPFLMTSSLSACKVDPWAQRAGSNGFVAVPSPLLPSLSPSGQDLRGKANRDRGEGLAQSPSRLLRLETYQWSDVASTLHPSNESFLG